MVKVIVLAWYVLNAMMSWVAESNHAYYEKPAVTDARYVNIALAIAEVALDPNQEPLFDNDEGRLQTALVLASIASHESKFVANVVNCRTSGDHGLAWGPWQTHSGKVRTCGDLKTAASIALGMARHSILVCKAQGYPLLEQLSVYTNGHCTRSSFSRARMGRGLAWYEKNKFDLIEVVMEEEDDEQYTSEYSQQDR